MSYTVTNRFQSTWTTYICRDKCYSYNKTKETRNAQQSLAYNPLGIVILPLSEYLWEKPNYWYHAHHTHTLAKVAELSMEDY